MKCAVEIDTARHFAETKDMPDFSDSLKREEARAIVIEELVNDPLEAVDMFSKDCAEFAELLERLRPAILNDTHFMNTLITNAMKTRAEEIQTRLGGNYE